jgi:hypothetical protein
MPTSTIPMKNKTSKISFEAEILLTLKRIKLAKKLTHAHNVFTMGEDNPFPGGLENGVGNLSPEIPYIKWGRAFEKNAPEKNAAR